MTQGVFGLDLLNTEQAVSLSDRAGWNVAIAAYSFLLDLLKVVVMMGAATGLGCAVRVLF